MFLSVKGEQVMTEKAFSLDETEGDSFLSAEKGGFY